MKTPREFRELKRAAKRLQKSAPEIFCVQLRLSACQQMTARMLGYRDWYEALVRLKKEHFLLVTRHEAMHELESYNEPAPAEDQSSSTG